MDPFLYYYQAAAVAAAPTYAEAVLALSPTAYWRLGEASGSPADSSGNGHTLTVAGSPTYGVSGWAGDGDTAMTFGTSRLTVADNNAWDLGTNDFTLVWAHSVAAGNWTALNDKQIIGHPGQGYDGEWWVRFRGIEDYLYLRLMDAATGTVLNAYLQTSANTLDTGGWVWCALTADRSGNATLYLNGTALGSGSESTAAISTASAYDLTTAQPLYIADNGAGTKYLPGSLDEVALWNGTLLTQSQVQALYDARNG